jgi:hypothetical protein
LNLPAIIAAACAVLEDDERIAKMGASHEARAGRLASVHTILHEWNCGTITSVRAESALRAVLLM